MKISRLLFAGSVLLCLLLLISCNKPEQDQTGEQQQGGNTNPSTADASVIAIAAVAAVALAGVVVAKKVK